MSPKERGRRPKARHLPPPGYDRAELIRLILGTFEFLGLERYRAALEAETGLRAAAKPFCAVESRVRARDWANAFAALKDLEFASPTAKADFSALILSQWVAECAARGEFGEAVACIRSHVYPLDPHLAETLAWRLFEPPTAANEPEIDALRAACAPSMYVDPRRFSRLLDYAQKYERFSHTARPLIVGDYARIETVLVHALHALGSDLGAQLSAEFGWGKPNEHEARLEAELAAHDWRAALATVGDAGTLGTLFKDQRSQEQALRLLLEYAISHLGEADPKEAIALARQYASADHELVGSLLLGDSRMESGEFSRRLHELVYNRTVSSSLLIHTLLDFGRRYQACIDPYCCSSAEELSLLSQRPAPRAGFPCHLDQRLVHDDEVWDLAFSPQGTYLATGTRSGKLYIWKVGARVARYAVYEDIHEDSIQAISWSADGTKVLTAGRDGCAVVVDVESCQVVVSVLGSETELSDVAAVCWARDGASFYTGSYDGNLIRWPLRGRSQRVVGEGSRVLAMELAEKGTRLVVLSVQLKTGGQTSHLLQVFDTETDKMVKEVEVLAALTSITVSELGYYAVNVVPHGLRVWYPLTPTDVEFLEGPRQQTYKIRSAFGGPYGKYLASGSEDCKVRVYNLATNSLVCELEGHTSVVNAVKWSGKILASASDDRLVCVWRPRE